MACTATDLAGPRPEELSDAMVASLDDLKGRNVLVLDVTRLSDLTDYMILASGTSERHVRALVDNVEATAKARRARILGIEGRAAAQWVLVDLGDVVVHVMQAETRAFYDLERLWCDVTTPEAEVATPEAGAEAPA